MVAFGDLVSGGLRIRNGTVPSCLIDRKDDIPTGSGDLVRIDLDIENGKVVRLAPKGQLEQQGNSLLDLDGGMILPALVDMHTHLDKGHIWPRRPNPDGTFASALASVGADRMARWTAEDVRTRMEFALKCAYVHGTSVVRTHIDSLPPQDEISWPVFKEIREAWAGRITLQGSCLFGIDRLITEPEFLISIADRVREAGGILGAVTYMIPDLERHLDAILRAATERGLDVDFHVDETKDPEARTLRAIAEAVLRTGYAGKVVCGHCCSLARQGDAEAAETMDLVAEAGLGIVSLPMCNMYLQDREAGRTPRWRGVTLLHEMRSRDTPVAVASDNTRDPFYAYGDLDLIEVYTQATRILQLDHPVGDWISTVTTSPARMLGVDAGVIGCGRAADLILFRTRNWSELMSRPGGPRHVLRAGRSVTETLPDYRELDILMQNSGAMA